MEKELQGKLVEILTSIQNGVGQARDFALGQLPDIAQSYVLYGRVSTLVTSILLLAFAAACAVFARWAYMHPWNTSPYSFDSGKERSDSNYIAMVLPTIASAMFTVSALLSFDWLVWLAPKVWLLKQLAHLVK